MRKVLLLVVLVIGLGFVTAHFMSHPAHALTAAGTIEARTIHIGSKVGGRIMAVHMREGQRVHAGDLLIVFDAPELQAALEQAQAQRANAAAALARLEHGARPEEIIEARANADKTQGLCNSQVAQARAELERAKIELGNAARSFHREETLRAKNLVSHQSLDDLESRWHTQEATVRVLEQALQVAQARLEAARAVTLRTENGSRPEDIDAGRAQLASAEAAVREAEAHYNERLVRAPVDAVVEVFDRQPGDLVAAGAVLARLLEDRHLHITVYVPEPKIAAVLLGQTVKVRVPALPGLQQSGRVEQIREEAEFLPRNVQTSEEREHQVIGVKVGLGETDPHLHPGMMGEVEFPAGSP